MAARSYLDWNATAPMREEAKAAFAAAAALVGNRNGGREAAAFAAVPLSHRTCLGTCRWTVFARRNRRTAGSPGRPARCRRACRGNRQDPTAARLADARQ